MFDPMVNQMVLSMAKVEPMDYRGWHVVLEAKPPVTIDTGMKKGESVPSRWLASLVARKPDVVGNFYVQQPLWLTADQLRKCKTPLDIDAYVCYMVDHGRKAIRETIDAYAAGFQKPEKEPEAMPPLDVMTIDFANDPRIKFKH